MKTSSATKMGTCTMRVSGEGNTMQIDLQTQRERAIWLAALLETDGRITLWGDRKRQTKSGNPRYISAYLSFSSDHKSVVEFAAQMFGTGRVRSYVGGTPRKPRWRWETSKPSEISIVLEMVSPFLTWKRPQATLAMEFANERLRRGRYARYSQHEYELVQQMDSLRESQRRDEL